MKRFSKIIVLLLSLTLAFVLVGCGSVEISFETESVTIDVNEERTLEPTINKEGLELEWSSDNTEAVTVDNNGKVTGLKEGSAVITVTVKDQEVSATITVNVNPVELSFSEESLTLKIDDEQTVTPVSSPAVTLNYVWSSSDEAVATVTQNGKIKAISIGQATITASAVGESATITVTVGYQDPTSIVINTNGTAAKKVGETLQLTATVAPINKAQQDVTWSSSNEAVATISATGLVEFLGLGPVEFTATSVADSSISKKVTIVGMEPDPQSITVSVEEGVTDVFLYNTLTMKAIVSPDLAKDEVTWSVSDETLATITPEGVLTAKKVGTVTVFAESNYKTGEINIKGQLDINIVLPEPVGVTVTGEETVIQVEEELQLTSTVVPNLASQEVTYESSDAAVATVDETGKVVGVTAGTVTITVKTKALDTVTDTYDIKVVDKITAPTHTNIIVDQSLADTERYSTFTVGELEYIVGVNAFVDFGKVTTADGSVVIVYPGSYSEELVISADNVVVKSLNADKNPNTNDYVLANEAVLNANVTVQGGTDNLTINGLAFTGAARVVGTASASFPIKVVTFTNNRVFDTDEATTEWQELAGYTSGFFRFASNDNYSLEDFVFTNNKFSNVSDANINFARVKNVTVTGNQFLNFDRDAIRFDTGGYNYGNFVFTDNVFANDTLGGYNGIFFRIYGGSSDDAPVNVLVENNTFKNIGQATLEKYSGALSMRNFQEKGAVINVLNNTFVTNANNIHIRNNATAENHTSFPWSANVNFNVFLGVPAFYYYNNLVGSDSTTTNPSKINLDHNFFGDADGNYIDITQHADKFDGYASMAYTFTSQEDVKDYQNGLFVDPTWSTLAAGDEVTVNGVTLVYGTRAFATLANALEAAESGNTIVVLPGAYDEDITVDKSVTLRSLNAGLNPTEDDTQFKPSTTEAPTNAAVLTGILTLAKSTITLKGLTFTGDAQIVSNVSINRFSFLNNFVFDTTPATATWLDNGYYNSGFMYLGTDFVWQDNTVISNNKFSNVSDANVYIKVGHNAVVTGNVFDNFGRDAVRFDYSANYGKFLIEDNTFTNGAYNAIFFRSLSWAFSSSNPTSTIADVDILNNYFYNVGTAAADAPTTRSVVGAISVAGFSESSTKYTSADINIQFNVFEECANYIGLRNNYASTSLAAWDANISYNAFIDADVVEYYHKNLFTDTDTTTSNPQDTTINYNFYGTSRDVAATIQDSQFDNAIADGLNGVVYSTYAELEEAILLLEILVDQNLAEVAADTVVDYKGKDFVVGTNAFATLEAALAAADQGSTVVLAEGTYAETVTVATNNVTVTGDNAVITGIINVAANVSGVTVDGLNFTDAGQVILALAGGVSDFTFKNNHVYDSTLGGSTAVLYFSNDGTAENNNIVIDNNVFDVIERTAAPRYVRGGNVNNLTITDNYFKGVHAVYNDAVRIEGYNDTNAGGIGAGGNVLIQGNELVNIGQRGMWFRRYSATSFKFIDNVINSAGDQSYGGGLQLEVWAGTGTTLVEIKENTFKNINAWFGIRFNNKDFTGSETWSVEVNYNKFIDFIALEADVTSYYIQAYSETTKGMINADFNYFSDGVTDDTRMALVGSVANQFATEAELDAAPRS